MAHDRKENKAEDNQEESKVSSFSVFANLFDFSAKPLANQAKVEQLSTEEKTKASELLKQAIGQVTSIPNLVEFEFRESEQGLCTNYTMDTNFAVFPYEKIKGKFDDLKTKGIIQFQKSGKDFYIQSIDMPALENALKPGRRQSQGGT